MSTQQLNTLSLEVSIASQTLSVFAAGKLRKQYAIATAKNGIGQLEGSECTPLGKHQIAEKIGATAPENAVFVGRQWTQEIYSEDLALLEKGRDWILTRILWLEGLEQGFNCGEFESHSCDTKGRYIYIHGCPDSHAMQIPSSHGCIKMRNADIIELFEWVSVGTLVSINTK